MFMQTNNFDKKTNTMRTKTFAFLSAFLIFVQLGFSQTLTRHPYLQKGASNQMTIRWRTDVACLGKVNYGTTLNNLSQSISEIVATTDHSLTLTGLTTETRYFYNIATGSTIFQGNADNFFYTFPVEGSTKKRRFWVVSDEGTGDYNQKKVRDTFAQYLVKNKITYIDGWLTLGDNVYQKGTEAEFQTNFFDIYKDIKLMRQTPLFPTLGNHDYGDNTTLQDSHEIPYKNNFSLPEQGQSGGVPSNRWEYYSYVVGNALFIACDSHGEENDKRFWLDEAQRKWLISNLEWAKTNKNIKWTILYWHHPPYSQGSHDSDNEQDLIDLRQNMVPIIDQYKVDLVLCGHSHVYERSRLMRGHTGKSLSFSPSSHLAPATTNGSSSGLYDGSAQSCPFIKKSDAVQNEGAIYVVAGTGASSYGAAANWPHRAMQSYAPFGEFAPYNNTEKGTLLLEIEGNRLDCKWIKDNGKVGDQFTMVKDVNKKSVQNQSAGKAVTLGASWVGTYRWSNNEKTRLIDVLVPTETNFYVSDSLNCFKDTIQVRLTTSLSADLVDFSGRNTEGGNHQLNWVTQNEDNIEGYEIEQKEKNDFSFKSIGFVKANNKRGTQVYSFQNFQQPYIPVIYYRLKVLNTNKKYIYSPIISLENTKKNKFQIYPNPTDGTIRIDFDENINQNDPLAKIEISDTMGRKIKEQSTENAQVDVSNLPAGIYFLKVKNHIVRFLKK
jgi:acid phosphatase type 7